MNIFFGFKISNQMISVLETHHVLRGVIDGTKADADEARTIREATDKTFMVWLVRGVLRREGDYGWVVRRQNLRTWGINPNLTFKEFDTWKAEYFLHCLWLYLLLFLFVSCCCCSSTISSLQLLYNRIINMRAISVVSAAIMLASSVSASNDPRECEGKLLI